MRPVSKVGGEGREIERKKGGGEERGEERRGGSREGHATGSEKLRRS